MKQLVVFSGPCGSGKTTAANAASLETGAYVCSFDALRKVYPNDEPSDLMRLLIKQVAQLFRYGKQTVIVDACNLHPHDFIRWETVAVSVSARLDWRRMNTALITCIERDELRPEPVGWQRITGQWISQERGELWPTTQR